MGRETTEKKKRRYKPFAVPKRTVSIRCDVCKDDITGTIGRISKFQVVTLSGLVRDHMSTECKKIQYLCPYWQTADCDFEGDGEEMVDHLQEEGEAHLELCEDYSSKRENWTPVAGQGM